MERNIPANISDDEIDAQFGDEDTDYTDAEAEEFPDSILDDLPLVEGEDLTEIEKKNIEKKYYE